MVDMCNENAAEHVLRVQREAEEKIEKQRQQQVLDDQANDHISPPDRLDPWNMG